MKDTRLVVGRNERENHELLKITAGKFVIMEPLNTNGPIASFERGNLDEETLRIVLRIVARYCDKKENIEFSVKLPSGEAFTYLVEKAFEPWEVEKFRG